MSDDGFIDLDLSNFEQRQRERFDAGDAAEDAEQWEETTAPWDDQRGFEDLYSPETLWKARLLLDSDAVSKAREDKYFVNGSQLYTVTIMESSLPVPWALCDCPNGTARGGRPSCYHTAAVLALKLGVDLSGYDKPRKGPARR